MSRLLDIGLERIKNLLMDMASLSEMTVTDSIESFENGILMKSKIFDNSENLRLLQLEIAEFAIELIARFQPVATDLRFLQSCLDISYGFMRFGRYAYDISKVLEAIGSLDNCNLTEVSEMSSIVKEMIRLSVNSLKNLDKEAASKLYQLDDSVDLIYEEFLREIINKDSNDTNLNLKCYISTLLVLRYLERISDHTCYIGDSIYYIVTGDPVSKRT